MFLKPYHTLFIFLQKFVSGEPTEIAKAAQFFVSSCNEFDSISYNEYQAFSVVECTLLCLSDVSCREAGYSHSERLCRIGNRTGCSSVATDERSTTEWIRLQRTPNGFMGSVLFAKSWYLLSSDVVDWHQARSSCNDLGFKLVEIETEAENNFIKEFMKQRNSIISAIGVWLGGYNYHKDQTFEWISNPANTMPFTDFYPEEPTDVKNEFCLLAYQPALYQWVDIVCDGQYHYICENML